MAILTEEIYNILEALTLTWFAFSYFGYNKRFSPILSFSVSFIILFLNANLMSLFSVSWVSNFLILVAILIGLMKFFHKGETTEHIMVAIISVILLALVNIYSFIFFCKIFGIEYNIISQQSSWHRFIAILLNKILFFIILSIIVLVKKKYTLLLRKTEYFLIIATLLISFIPVLSVRKIVNDSPKYYGIFLIMLLSVLIINIIQFYTIVYISKKNITEQNVIIMKKQLEMQEQSLKTLEEKYDETAKIRHDMKNHISCALAMAEQVDNAALVDYLRSLSDDMLIPSDSYIRTGRNVINAVINTKFELAKSHGFDMQCVVIDEMTAVSSLDCGVLLSNLLDNAIEACEKNKGCSEIFLKIWADAGYYCIELSNTVEYDVLEKNPQLITSKPDKKLHGMGLRSIRDIVSKYNGMINFYQNGNKFYTLISLCRYNI